MGLCNGHGACLGLSLPLHLPFPLMRARAHSLSHNKIIHVDLNTNLSGHLVFLLLNLATLTDKKRQLLWILKVLTRRESVLN